MRVVRIITRLNVGGPAIQAIELSRRLSDRGFSTLLIDGSLGPGEGDMAARFPLDATFVRQHLPALQRRPAPMADLKAFIAIYRAIRRWRPDVVHTHMAKAGALGRMAAALHNLTARRRTRVVHTYHGHVLDGYFSPRAERILIAVERMLARRSDALVAIAPALERELRTRYAIGRPAQYRLVPLGFDLAPFEAIGAAARADARRALDIAPDQHVVAAVGRLTAIKRLDLLLDAAALVCDADPKALFLVVGDGELREVLEAQAGARHNLGGRVRFLGWRLDLERIYAASDLLMLTSRNEGTPVALIEAMASGVPGVASLVGGVGDVIGGPDTGIGIGDLAPAAYAHAVLDLLSDDSRRIAMGARARARVLARYGIGRLVDDIEALYREMAPA